MPFIFGSTGLLSSPIAVVVDRAYRQAVRLSPDAKNQASPRDGLGDRFIGNYFISAEAVVEALQSELLSLINDFDAAALLTDQLKSQIRAELHSRPHELAVRVVAQLSSPDKKNLQAAVLKFLKGRQGASFCFKLPSSETSPTNRRAPRCPKARSGCPGREMEMAEIVGSLLQPGVGKPAVVLGGAGGIGKTTLALLVLNEAAVKRRYEARRFWISCEMIISADDFLEAIFAALSSSATLSSLFSPSLDNTDEDFLGHLDRIADVDEPTIVAFDNLETIFDREHALVERVLSLLHTQTAILITMRGQRRPSIGFVWSWPASNDSRIESLPEAAWCSALEIHAGFELKERDRIVIEPVLRQIRGYPLALCLLGLRLARGEATVQELKQAWDDEILRDETSEDTRETSIITSIRVSLTSPSVATSPLAIETLVLAANLPPLHRSKRGERWFRSNGLPKWLGQALCGSEAAQRGAWAALTQCGLAYTDPDEPSCLRLIPPIQETIRRRQSVALLSESTQIALMSTMQDFHEANTATSYPWQPDDGTYGDEALLNLRLDSRLIPSCRAFAGSPAVESVARSAHLLGMFCRDAGFHSSGAALFNEANHQYAVCGRSQDAVHAQTLRLRLDARAALHHGHYDDSADLYEEEGSLLDALGRHRDAAWAHARGQGVRARLAWQHDLLEAAASYCSEEAALWDKAVRPQQAAIARAKVHRLHGLIAERGTSLGGAAQLYDNEAAERALAEQPEIAADARARGCELRARIAENGGQLEDAARHLDEAVAWYDEAKKVENAAEARRHAEELRARIVGATRSVPCKHFSPLKTNRMPYVRLRPIVGDHPAEGALQLRGLMGWSLGPERQQPSSDSGASEQPTKTSVLDVTQSDVD